MVVDRAHVAWMEGHITGVLLMDMKACVLSVGRGRLIHMISGKGTDRDLIWWTACYLTDWMVVMVIVGNDMQIQSVEAGIPQASQVSPNPLYNVHVRPHELGWGESLRRWRSVLHGRLGHVSTGNNANQVIRKPEACARGNIDGVQSKGWCLTPQNLTQHSWPGDEASRCTSIWNEAQRYELGTTSSGVTRNRPGGWGRRWTPT